MATDDQKKQLENGEKDEVLPHPTSTHAGRSDCNFLRRHHIAIFCRTDISDVLKVSKIGRPLTDRVKLVASIYKCRDGRDLFVVHEPRYQFPPVHPVRPENQRTLQCWCLHVEENLGADKGIFKFLFSSKLLSHVFGQMLMLAQNDSPQKLIAGMRVNTTKSNFSFPDTLIVPTKSVVYKLDTVGFTASLPQDFQFQISKSPSNSSQ